MRLIGQFLLAHPKEQDNLRRQRLGVMESLREQQDFANLGLVRLCHGDRSEQLLQVIGEVRTAGIVGIHRDKDSNILIHLYRLVHQHNLVVILERPLDTLDLLRDGRHDSFFESIEFIKAAPSADLTETQKDATNSVEIKALVTAEYENKFAKEAAE